MPGITITPGTAWPVRPLAEVTRPMVWPQPRRSIAMTQPDQFQSRWVDDEVPLPNVYWLESERRYYKGYSTSPLLPNYELKPQGASLAFDVFAPPTEITLSGLRYATDGLYDVTWENFFSRFYAAAPPAPAIVLPEDYPQVTVETPWCFAYDGEEVPPAGTSVDVRGAKIVRVLWPDMVFDLVGYDDGAVRDSMVSGAIATQGPIGGNRRPYGDNIPDSFFSPIYSPQYFAYDPSGFALPQDPKQYREIIAMTWAVRVRRVHVRVADNSIPAIPPVEYVDVDLRGEAFVDAFYHKRVGFPSGWVLPSSSPYLQTYSRMSTGADTRYSVP